MINVILEEGMTMKAPIVCTVLAFMMCAAFAHSSSAQGAATVQQEQAQFLLSQIEQYLGQIRNFRCQRITPLPPLPGTEESAAPRYRGEWIAADRQGRGRVKSSEAGRITTQIWDGQKTIEHQARVDSNGTVTNQVFVAKGAQFQTERHNEPWDYLGRDVADLLRATLEGRYSARIRQVNTEYYRLDIRTPGGTLYTFNLDPQQGYVPVYRRVDTDGKIQTLETVTFKKVESGRTGENIWFPFEVQTEIDRRQKRLASPALKCRFVDVSVNNYDFEQSLRLVFAEGTRVYDRVRNRSYIVGEETTEPIVPPAPVDANIPAPAPTPETETPPAETPVWRTAFDAAYQLEDGQALKCVTPPFIPERSRYLISVEPDLAELSERVVENRLYRFQWDDGLRANATIGTNRYLRLSAILEEVVGLDSYQYDGVPYLLNLPLTGDWVVRQNAPTPQMLASLEQIVRDQFRRPIRFVEQQVDAIVVRASGTYRFRPLSLMPNDRRVHLFAGRMNSLRADMNGRENSGTLTTFLDHVGHAVGMRLVDGTTSSSVQLRWVSHDSAQLRNVRNSRDVYNAQLASLLSNLTNQTGLSFQVESGTVDQWQVAVQSGVTARSN